MFPSPILRPELALFAHITFTLAFIEGLLILMPRIVPSFKAGTFSTIAWMPVRE